MALGGRKRLWLAAALACIGVGLHFVAQMREAQEPGLQWLSSDPSVSSGARTSQVPRRLDNIPMKSAHPGGVSEGIAGRGVSTGKATRSGNSPDAGFPASEDAAFLDPDIQSVWVYQARFDPTPVMVGEYLDPNAESFASTARHTNGIEQTPVQVGKYLDPAPGPLTPLIMIGEEHGTTDSAIGRYLDPDTESLETSSAIPSHNKNVGAYVEADM